jgi:hypothetical protein
VKRKTEGDVTATETPWGMLGGLDVRNLALRKERYDRGYWVFGSVFWGAGVLKGEELLGEVKTYIL